jgi:hypothetical protein
MYRPNNAIHVSISKVISIHLSDHVSNSCVKNVQSEPFSLLRKWNNDVYFCSKLGVPIKTTISATILEEALNGTVTIRPLPLGRPVHDKVELLKEILFD